MAQLLFEIVRQGIVSLITSAVVLALCWPFIWVSYRSVPGGHLSSVFWAALWRLTLAVWVARLAFEVAIWAGYVVGAVAFALLMLSIHRTPVRTTRNAVYDFWAEVQERVAGADGFSKNGKG